MSRNPWIKLSAVALGGIFLSFAIIWGIGQVGRYTNAGYNVNGYRASGYYTNNNGMYMQGQASGNMNMQGQMNGQQGTMGMDKMDDDMMNMNSQQGGMGMMGM